MERKPTRNIDLLFFTYRSYYDENDDYNVHWEIDWVWTFIAGFIVVSLFTV